MHLPEQQGDSVGLPCNDEDSQLHLKLSTVSFTEYDSDGEQEISYPVAPAADGGADILSSTSSVSLGPAKSPLDGRRTLLLVYIHGFMGAEDSFRRFPAHVHNLVANALADSHVVYSKVYPRYKSRRAMGVARDEFSEWIIPHESHQTDVILLGHSLGGILAAEVALAEVENMNSPSKYRHRILGMINFDVPFLGMHPSVVGTGLGALFQPKRKDGFENEALNAKRSESQPSELGSQESMEMMPSWFDQIPDPNFDPPFPNDVRRVKRSQLDGAINFLKKNSGNLAMAVKEYASSYVEFGGCLADYSGLRRRYAMLKELEAIDDMEPKTDRRGLLQRRLRFINYYTASPGFPKKSPSNLDGQELTDEMPPNHTIASTDSLDKLTKLPSPTISVGSFDSTDDGMINVEPTPIVEDPTVANLSSSKQSCDVSPEQSTVDHESVEGNDQCTTTMIDSLPPLPEIPAEPPALDPSLYEDKDILKQARKEHTRLVKLHERVKKEHDTTLKEREKLVQKLAKKKQKLLSSSSTETESKESLNRYPVSPDDHIEKRTPLSATVKESTQIPISDAEEMEKLESNNSSSPFRDSPIALLQPPKDRVFCALPGSSDRLWVRIFMPDIDEVVAHQSIFLPNGLYYEWLVNDTAARIEQWVQDDCTRRVIWEQFGEFS
ncbi:hypothetical protein UA08_04253 [Talaromyces atroroseus]|uniref:DUF676 domain-containing protein n=1 Tax=Talaromyces atroroseus TaxID=1441469 RepID=A0A1Q5Q995_TALAT|nr:hypothetical protein UA08_04253 [Talaromyces atroroseus]OKL60703.1 hypothetical protein UA08_04253 [Talaromyces atroroseus]